MTDEEGPEPPVSTREKTPTFLQDIQNQKNEIIRACRRLGRMVSHAGSDELVTFSDEILIMTKAFVKQHASLAETRAKRDDFEKFVYKLETGFWDLVEYCETNELGTPWEDFITFVLDILSVCQSFLDESDMLLENLPPQENFVEDMWTLISGEMTKKLKLRKHARAG